MASTVPIVQANISISGAGVSPRLLGRTLFMTNDVTLPASNRLQLFDSLEEIEGTFADGTEPKTSGEIYFGRDEQPQGFFVGRILNTTQPAQIEGGTAAALAIFQGISDGVFEITLDGFAIQIGPIDFTAAANFSDVVNALNTALSNAGVVDIISYSGVTQSFTYTADLAVTSLGFLTASSLAGTQLFDLLGLSATTAVGKTDKVLAETLVEAFNAFQEINNTFYFVVLDVAYRDDPQVIDLAQEIQAQGLGVIGKIQALTYKKDGKTKYTLAEKIKLLEEALIKNRVVTKGLKSQSLAAKLINNSASQQNPYMLIVDSADETLAQFITLNGLQLDRTVGNYQEQVANPIGFTKYLSVSVASYLSSTDFNELNGVKNSADKPMPLIQANKLSSTLIAQLDSLNVNYYNVVGGDISTDNVVASYFNGTTFKNQIYQDIRYNVDWLTTILVTNLTNFRIGEDSLPRTAEGQNAALTVIDQTLENQASPFGMIAPGQLSQASTFNLRQVTGNAQATGFLQKGFTSFAPPLTQESEINRANRVPLELYFWAKSSGQINSFIINGVIDL